jgi:hypothetical protein
MATKKKTIYTPPANNNRYSIYDYNYSYFPNRTNAQLNANNPSTSSNQDEYVKHNYEVGLEYPMIKHNPGYGAHLTDFQKMMYAKGQIGAGFGSVRKPNYGQNNNVVNYGTFTNPDRGDFSSYGEAEVGLTGKFLPRTTTPITLRKSQAGVGVGFGANMNADKTYLGPRVHIHPEIGYQPTYVVGNGIRREQYTSPLYLYANADYVKNANILNHEMGQQDFRNLNRDRFTVGAGFNYEIPTRQYDYPVNPYVRGQVDYNFYTKQPQYQIGVGLNNFEEGGWLDTYDNGGMIKRADGHYSRRGLWDNIRANKGSGKKPTKQMLEQEAKIRKQYGDGGQVTFSAGGEKHKVYKKESPTGNGKGIEGHIMVTHPTMDKGKWDTIDLTEIAGAKTVAQGVAATKEWHEENPNEYANGGYVVKRSNARKGKTHVVIGPDGTKKYFGDSKLGQHPNDPARKKAFYARHKHNLEHNPYFRAFARKTWRDGGELDMYENGGKSDYNMLGYAVHHPVGALKHMINPEKYHATDEYKRPNHMTFSDESKYSNNEHPGGHWSQTPDGKWTFTPTDFNIENAGGPERYQQWWDQTEGRDGNLLILPKRENGGNIKTKVSHKDMLNEIINFGNQNRYKKW